MYRAAHRSAARAIRSTRPSTFAPGPRRWATTSAADKPRTWKDTAVRFGLAIGALYWYNTSPVFADEIVPQTVPAPPQFSDADLPTVESVIEQKRNEAEAKAVARKTTAAPPAAPTPTEQQPESVGARPASSEPVAVPGSPEALEGEAGQEGAFDPETGEINWDCPCLGGMAHGPCGEEFKAAFSCFVYSKEDPKGIDCVDKFQYMQDCFRKYPEIYGAELDEDEDEDEGATPVAADEEAEAPGLEDQIASKTSQSSLKTRASPAASTASTSEPQAQVPSQADSTPAATTPKKEPSSGVEKFRVNE